MNAGVNKYKFIGIYSNSIQHVHTLYRQQISDLYILALVGAPVVE